MGFWVLRTWDVCKDVVFQVSGFNPLVLGIDFFKSSDFHLFSAGMLVG